MDHIRHEINDEGIILRQFHLNGRSLRSVDQFINLLGCTHRIRGTFIHISISPSQCMNTLYNMNICKSIFYHNINIQRSESVYL